MTPTQNDESCVADVSTPARKEATGRPWEDAVEPICRAVGAEVGNVVREVSDGIYQSVMETVQDYLKENVEYNLASTLSAIERSNKDLRETNSANERRIAELEKALRLMVTYADWTVGPESPGHHPTFPSAIGVARAALEGTKAQ